MIDRAFTPFPILTTERLTLRQLAPGDVEAVFALRSDREINKYLDRQPSKTLEDARDFIIKVSEAIEKSEAIYWAVTMTESKTLAGAICLFGFSDSQGKCEIGYELSTSFQGKGIMKEAALKVIEYAIHTIKLEAIEALVHIDNEASIRLLEKLGFKKTIKTDKTISDCNIFELHANR